MEVWNLSPMPGKEVTLVSGKKAFVVGVREVYVQPYRVVAETPEEAVRLVADGEGDILDADFEYSHTLNPDTWTVEEMRGAGR